MTKSCVSLCLPAETNCGQIDERSTTIVAHHCFPHNFAKFNIGMSRPAVRRRRLSADDFHVGLEEDHSAFYTLCQSNSTFINFVSTFYICFQFLLLSTHFALFSYFDEIHI